jgi:hypothetical protein
MSVDSVNKNGFRTYSLSCNNTTTISAKRSTRIVTLIVELLMVGGYICDQRGHVTSLRLGCGGGLE